MKLFLQFYFENEQISKGLLFLRLIYRFSHMLPKFGRFKFGTSVRQAKQVCTQCNLEKNLETSKNLLRTKKMFIFAHDYIYLLF